MAPVSLALVPAAQDAHDVAPGLAANDPTLLKRPQLARAINVSARTVDNWQKKKIIPHLKVGRSVRFDLQRVLAALRRFEIREVR